MSYIATQAHSILTNLFPSKPIKQVFCEYYVNYKGQKLYFDFYIKKLDIFVEVQGQQHTKFVKHFHQDKEAFVNQKARDNLKIEWIEENGFGLIRINYDENITEALILDKITNAMNGGLYE